MLLIFLVVWSVQDVSTVLELCRRWYPKDYKHAPRNRGRHTAFADIQVSTLPLNICCSCWHAAAFFADVQLLLPHRILYRIQIEFRMNSILLK